MQTQDNNQLNQSIFKDILFSVIVNEVDSLKDPFFDFLARTRDELRPYYLNPKIAQTKIWMELRADKNEVLLHTVLRIAQGFSFRVAEEELSEKLNLCLKHYLNPCGLGMEMVDEGFIDEDFRSKLAKVDMNIPMWLAILLIAGMFYKSYVFELNELYPIARDGEGSE